MWPVIFIICQICWLWALVAHLRSKNLEPTDKICWTIVLCLLNIIGLILYAFFGPKGSNEYKSEAELKKRINQQFENDSN